MPPSPSDAAARTPSVVVTLTAVLCAALLGCASAPPDPPAPQTNQGPSSGRYMEGEGAGVEDEISLRLADYYAAEIDSLLRVLVTAPVVSPEAHPEERPAPETPGRWYWAYVANRESDVVSRVRFGPKGVVYEKSVEVGVMPRETDGPVAVRVAPDGKHWYLTTSAASPMASLFKYETGTDRLVTSLALGASFSSVALTPDAAEAWISYAGADGGRGGGSAFSVVRTDGLREVGRLRPCSRSGAGGVARSGDRLWVACTASDEVVELDAGSREVRRRYRVGSGPASLAVSPGGDLLLAANREGGTLSVIDLDEGREVARLATSQSHPGGVAVSDDGRYAFVANAAGSARRSTMDVFDLRAMVRVADVEVEHGAAGIAFWRSLPVKR